MKKLILLLLTLLLLCGCAQGAPETEPPTTEAPATEATAEPTTEPTTEPTEPEPEFRHPLTGVPMDAPLTTRCFAVSIGNTRESLPHFGVSKADILFESFVNGHTTRRFALYSDISQVEAIGGSRSMRMQFTDLCLGYDAVGVYAAGSNTVIGDLNQSGVDGIVSQQWGADFHWREQSKLDQGVPYEHTLMVNGQGLVDYAVAQGYAVEQEPGKDYGLLFAEEAAPAEGEIAESITMKLKLYNTVKETLLTYDEALGAYTLSQYGIECVDGFYGVPETYKNVFLLLMPNTNIHVYHVVESVGSGEGWFACDGKLIPILWHREENTLPFRFTHTDGTPLEIGIGSSYMALAPLDSTVEYGPAVEAEAETFPE